MSFLAPLFLLGALGIAVPIILHLTRHDRGKPVAFPSLMFLERIPFQETSRRKVRHWSLLLLRGAALLLLAAAFARPLVQDGNLALVGGPGPQELVILLDQSSSMDRAAVWTEALAEARGVVSAAQPLDRISLVGFSQTPTLYHRSVTDHDRVLATLDTLQAGSLGTRYGPAIKLAANTVAASNLSRGHVVLISDMQRVGWTPDRDARLPEGTSFESRVLGLEREANLSLSDLELARTSVGGRDRVSVRARVVNHGADSAEADVSLTVDGTSVQSLTVSVGGRNAAPVTFDPFLLSEEFTRGGLVLGEDAMGGDNGLYFVLSPGNTRQVLIVDPSRTEDSHLYLRQALGISNDAGFSTVLTQSTPTQAQLDQAHVVVLNGAPYPGGEGGARLRRFVEGGGGLLMALGTPSRWPADQADLFPGSLGGVLDTDPAEGRLGFMDYDHPVLEIFRGDRSGDFSRARFYRIRNVDVTSGRVLARLSDGAPALIENTIGDGRVLTWTSGLDRLWNDLALQPVYLPFVQQMVRHLAGGGDVPEWHRAGSTVSVQRLAETQGIRTLPEGAVGMSPDGGNSGLDGPDGLLNLTRTGIWEIRTPGTQPTRPFALAVNGDPAESDLARLDVEEFAGSVAGAPAVQAAGTAPAPQLQAQDLEKRQSFWRFILAGVFLLLVAETLLSNRLSRHVMKEAATL